ncbi:FAD/NAD(P)-binding protein [Lysobacter sp. A421]
MTNPTLSVDVAIIGGGAAGVMTAIHLLRLAATPLQVVLVEPAAMLGEGVAYASRAAEHRLNVPVQRMSAFVDRPEDFLDFMLEHHGSTDRSAGSLAASYAQRRHYADYLRDRLRQAGTASVAQLEVVHDRAVAMTGSGPDWRVRLASGATVCTRNVVLAMGNTMRPLPALGVDALSVGQYLEAWQYESIVQLRRDADIAIIGSGLSMADVVLSLHAGGHRGRIHVLSRHALMPLPHADTHGAADFDPATLLALSLRQRLKALRGHAANAIARGEAWQGVIDCIRPHVQALWQSLSVTDQRRFLRHVVRQWDVHRHRIAPDVHTTIDALRACGQLRLHRGRLQAATSTADGVRLEVQRADGDARMLKVDHLVNATGVETRAVSMRNVLLQGLLATGVAVPGPHGIGIDTAANGEVIARDGAVQATVLALGSLRIGSLWESLAVPELRSQSEAIARKLLGGD